MRYEIYVIRESDDASGKDTEEEEEGAMAVDGGGGIDGASSTPLLLSAARSHVSAAVASSPARVRDHLWYRDSLLSSLSASTEAEPPWRRKELKKKSLHASADASTSTSPASPPPPLPCLWGELDFGDAVDDEWAAAWMLLKATAEGFKAAAAAEGEEGRTTTYRLAARCWDDDGDFLLIEAAEALPRWLSPLNSENRCWLFGGRVHLIPRRWSGEAGANRVGEQQQQQQRRQQQQPTLVEALGVLSRGGLCSSSSSSSPSPPSSPSDAGPKVHAALAKRLGDPRNPPKALLRPLHSARALVPPRLAALLLSSSQSPGLVSAAVDAFYRRDPRGLRAASRARWFPCAPSSAAGGGAPPSRSGGGGEGRRAGAEARGAPPPSLVPALVRTTRLQFAQLALQQYAPPTKGAAGWPCLPLAHRDAAAVELGAKLAAGFEILMATAAATPTGEEEEDGGGGGENQGDGPPPSSSSASPSPPSPSFSAPLPSDPLSLDALDPPGWRDYLKALEARGAFDGELKGSARHQELRRQAAAAFSSRRRAGAAASASPSPFSPAAAAAAPAPAAAAAGGDARAPSPPSSAASAAALRVASILKSLGEVDAEALRAAGEAAVAAEGESPVGWLRAAASASASASAAFPASSSEVDGGGGGESDEDEFLAAIAAAEAGQTAEAERKLRRRTKKKKEEQDGGGSKSGAGDDGDDGDDEGKNGADFDPASVVDRVKSFVEKMSSWEGAEAQAQAQASDAAAAASGAAAAANDDDGDDDAARFAGDRGGVTLDESSFWDELGAALGVPLSGVGGLEEGLAAAAAAAGERDEEEGSDGSDEGSSFYSDGSGDDSGSDGGEGAGEEGDPSRLPRKLLEAEAARLRALEASGSRVRRGAPPPEESSPLRGAAGSGRFAFPASSAAAAAAEAAAEAAAKKQQKKPGRSEEGEDDDFAFATAYEAELGRQLRGTTLGQTWGGGGGGGGGRGEQGEEEDDDDDDDDDAADRGLPRASKRAATSASAVGGSSGIACLDHPPPSSTTATIDSDNANPLAPVDVDVNLLESLLASYAGEAGFPGPASTLAGMLGVSLGAPAASAPSASRPSAFSASSLAAAAAAAAAAASPALAPPTPSTSEKE